MAVKEKAGARGNIFFDAAVKRFQILVRPGRPHGRRRLIGAAVNRAAENVPNRHGFVQIGGIAVGIQQNAAAGKNQLTVSQNITKVIQPLRVPVHVFEQSGKLVRQVLQRNLRRNHNAAVANHYQNIRSCHNLLPLMTASLARADPP